MGNRPPTLGQMASQLTPEQLERVEKIVYENVPISKNEEQRIGFCSSRKRSIEDIRNTIRKNEYKKLLREKVEQSKFI